MNLHLKSEKASLNSYVSTIVRKNKYKSREFSLIPLINKESPARVRREPIPAALLGKILLYYLALFAEAFRISHCLRE